MPITVIITDDHQLLRQTWEQILNDDPMFKVIGAFGNGELTVEAARILAPDVVLMDAKLPGMDGMEATRLIREMSPATKVLGFSFYADVTIAAGMIKAGAMGFVTKNCNVQEVLIALVSIHNNQYYLCEEMKMYKSFLLQNDDN